MGHLVSVIIPCYNAEKTISKSIQSVIEQDWSDIELIVIDDGSTDNSKAEILKWCKNDTDHVFVKYIYQENAGPAAAINRGLKEVHGEYLSLLDADDYYLPSSISERANYLDNHPSCLMVRSNGYIKSGNNTWLFVYDEKEKNNSDVFTMLMKGETNNWAGSYMIRTEQLFEFYPDRMIYPSRFGQNLQLMLPMAQKGSCGFIDKLLMVYVQNSDSLTREKDILRKKEKSISNIEGYYDIRLHMIERLFETSKEKEYWKNVAEGIMYKAKMYLGLELNDQSLATESYRYLKTINQLDVDSQIRYWNSKNQFVSLLLRAKRKLRR